MYIIHGSSKDLIAEIDKLDVNIRKADEDYKSQDLFRRQLRWRLQTELSLVVLEEKKS